MPPKPKPKPKAKASAASATAAAAPRATASATASVAAPTAPAARRRPKLKWRTRDSQNSQLYNLQLDVNDLQQEIQQLEQMRAILRLQTRLNRMDDRDGSYVKVVREYHRVFRHGFQPVVAIEADVVSSGGNNNNNSSTSSSTRTPPPRLVDTMEFLSRVVDEGVSIGRFVGLDMMRDQWTRYSAALANLDLRHVRSTVLPQMDYVAPGGDVRPVAMVSSEATYECVFTLDTMQLMFPQVLARRGSVAERLLGRTFRGLAHFDFVFDTNTHRVVGYDFRVDLFAAFARLLHDPEDLCLLFDGATISEESLIGDLNVYRQGPGSPTLRRLQDGSQHEEYGAATPQPPPPELHNPPPTEHTLWPHRAVIDPVVRKYATRGASDEKQRERERRLHSKLTSILDPADRVAGPAAVAAAVTTAESADATAALGLSQQQQQQQQQQQRQQQQEDELPEASANKTWQLKIANLLAAVEQDDDEIDDVASGPSRANANPSLATFRSSFSSNIDNQSGANVPPPASSSSRKHKRANPFAPAEPLLR